MSDFKNQKLRLLVDSLKNSLKQLGVSRLYLIENEISWKDLEAQFPSTPIAGRWNISSPWHEPYEPFLGVIKKWFQNLSPLERKRHLKHIYPLHRDILSDYFSGKKPRRNEPLINEEVNYEMEKWYQELTYLFWESMSAYQGGAVFYIFENANYLLPSSYELLKQIAKKAKFPQVFLLFYDSNFLGLEGFSIVENLIKESEHRDVPFGFEFIPAENFDTVGWKAQEPSLSEICRLVRLQRIFCAFDDIALMCQKYVLLDFTSELDLQRREMLNEIVLSYVDVLNKKGDYRKAYLYAQQILKSVRFSQEGIYVLLAQIQMAIAEFRANSLDSAYYFAQLALKLARNLNEERFIVLSEILIFYIRTGSNETNLALQLIERLKKMGWHNCLALVLSFGGYLVALQRQGIKTNTEILELAQQGMNLAQKLKNQVRLSVCYHARGVIHSIKGEYNQAKKFYQKSLALKKRLGDPHQLAKILNSLGYLELLTGDFERSQANFAQALQTLNRTRFYIEQCGSLYNLGKIALLSFRYAEASSYLSDMIKIMDKLHIQDLAFQPRVSIYALKGISHFLDGAKVNAWNSLQKIYLIPRYEDQIKRNSFYWLLVILLQSPDLVTETIIQNVLNTVSQEGYPFLLFDHLIIGDHLVATQPLKAQELWQKGRELCLNQQNIPWFLKLFEARLGYSNSKPESPRFKKVYFQVETTLELVNEDQNLNALEKKIHEIDFISQFQNLVIIHEKRQQLVENSHLLLSLHFAHDAALLVNTADEVYPDGIELGEDWESLLAWIQLKDLDEIKKWAMSKNFLGAELIQLKTKSNEILALVLFSIRQNFELANDDRSILSVFLNQFHSAMELIKTRETLVMAAKTDKLTGLHNRLEIERLLYAEHERIHRYAQKGSHPFSLMYLDLDNFKLCNDTFGHDVGDLVLVEFAKILRGATRAVDNVGRLGGDEFLILLPETRKEEAVVVAKRIFSMLNEVDHFVSQIEKHLGRSVCLEPHQKISCSIGIVEAQPFEGNTPKDIIKQADQALYKAKNLGKNQYVVG